MHKIYFIFLLIQSDLAVCLQVNIQVPAPDQQSDKIAITGLANHLDRAKEGLLDRVKELQAEQEDRVSIVWSVLKCLCGVDESHTLVEQLSYL